MKPKRIILVRHGESEGNANHNVYGEKPDYTLKLTQIGIKQALKAGTQLKKIIGNESVRFYVSPLWRARETFELISCKFSNKYDFREDPRLREQEYGHIRHIDITKKMEKERDAYGTFYYRMDDGESGADVYDRVSDFLNTLHRDFDKKDYPDNTVIVSHGFTIRAFIMRWFHSSVEAFESWANPKNCQFIILKKNPDNHYKIEGQGFDYDPPLHQYQYQWLNLK
jgi:broad specificity phosphatase PhoE